MSIEDDVREASRKFYHALSRMCRGEPDTMAEVWAQHDGVSAHHPIGGRDRGWPAVRDSFNGVAAISTDGEVRLDEQEIHASDGLAVETGIERGAAVMAGRTIDIEHRVTNVYQLDESDSWRLVHHHTDMSPAMAGLIAELQAEGAGAH